MHTDATIARFPVVYLSSHPNYHQTSRTFLKDDIGPNENNAFRVASDCQRRKAQTSSHVDTVSDNTVRHI